MTHRRALHLALAASAVFFAALLTGLTPSLRGPLLPQVGLVNAGVQTPTPVPLACSGGMGGQLYAYHAIILDLPVGHVYAFRGQSGALGNWASICILEYSSMIVFDSMTGQEIQRTVNDPRAIPVLDQIARNITLNPMPTPQVFLTPPSRPPAPVERGIPITPGGGTAAPGQRSDTLTPPRTGEAGIAR